jgi:hypothetical protein
VEVLLLGGKRASLGAGLQVIAREFQTVEDRLARSIAIH